MELSIVLVILGLLTGGILTGQSLIRAAELRSITTELNEHVTAINTFKGKYFSLPGDMANATQFWGKNATYCNSHTGTAIATGTCNGNGDGTINNAGGSNQNGEGFQIWNQLALAGLINGQYTGISGPLADSDMVLGGNVPASKFPSSGFGFDNHNYSSTSSSTRFAYHYINSILFGNRDTSFGRLTGAALNPEEAWNIDKKIDDGHPAYGKAIAVNWNNQCTSPISGGAAYNNLNAAYRLSDTTKRCAFHFMDMF